MNEYKIVYDPKQKMPWGCYGRKTGSIILSLFFDDWELQDRANTYEDAILYVQTVPGKHKFIGVFHKDGKRFEGTKAENGFYNIYIP
jgi:hypothetical protein